MKSQLHVCMHVVQCNVGGAVCLLVSHVLQCGCCVVCAVDLMSFNTWARAQLQVDCQFAIPLYLHVPGHLSLPR